MLVRPKALNDLRLQNLVQDRLYQLRKPILTAQKSWQEILADVNIIPSHRFAPSVKNVSESSSTEPKRWLPTSEFTALYGRNRSSHAVLMTKNQNIEAETIFNQSQRPNQSRIGMAKRNLIIIHRGPEYERDFEEIAIKVNALDRDITVYHLPARLEADLPKHAWQYPSLTVALTAEFRLPIRRGRILKSLAIEKLVQHDIFNKARIPTPHALPFRFGMTLDPILFGDFVIIKPMDLDQTSTGDGIHLIRRRRLHEKKWRDFPPQHPIQQAKNGYIVQKFVDTGAFPSFFRIQTFLGKAIYAWHSTLVTPRCSLDASDTEIEQTTVASQGGEKTRRLIDDADMIEIAERVHAALPFIPMLAVDCVREIRTGKIFVLECNPGGNTWHFSSKIGEKLRMGFGDEKANGAMNANALARKMFIEQFGAFDIVAERLARATQSKAE